MISSIVFAAGCFWGVEKHFEALPGVVNVVSGYSGGTYENPTYKKVLKYRSTSNNEKNFKNHTEAVEVSFDNTKITANELIKSFWEIHDPTQENRQGNDIGNNYRSAIFFTNEKQKQLALHTKEQYQKLLKKEGYGKIKTEIEALNKFYGAESVHQDYLKKNPNGYCPNHSTGVKFIKDDKKDKKVDLDVLKGKEIIVVEADGYCPYCEQFKKDVANTYKGSIPMRFANTKQLKNYKINSKLFASPTILFIEDGVEQTGHIGYMNKKKFYETLGDFKLGKNTLAYKIAFENGTESSYCKAYDIFKDTPDGVFIDKVSGEILFDTKDRFVSKSGWLSFYKAVDGTTIELPDNRYGMKRIEVKAKKSGIHLGHVFPKANGKRRFCINANVLEFVKRADVKL